jgi:hypothetical protein
LTAESLGDSVAKRTDPGGRPHAWLSQFDAETWASVGVTADQWWVFAPAGRHRPDLRVIDDLGNRVGSCRRPFGPVQVLELAGHELRLRAPLNPLRAHWHLRDEHGALGRIEAKRPTDRPLETLTIEWDRPPPSLVLLTLLITYSLALEYGTRFAIASTV